MMCVVLALSICVSVDEVLLRNEAKNTKREKTDKDLEESAECEWQRGNSMKRMGKNVVEFLLLLLEVSVRFLFLRLHHFLFKK